MAQATLLGSWRLGTEVNQWVEARHESWLLQMRDSFIINVKHTCCVVADLLHFLLSAHNLNVFLNTFYYVAK